MFNGVSRSLTVPLLVGRNSSNAVEAAGIALSNSASRNSVVEPNRHVFPESPV